MVGFAVLALQVAVPIVGGVVLGFLASSAWWDEGGAGSRPRGLRPVVQWGVRLWIAALRSPISRKSLANSSSCQPSRPCSCASMCA